MKKLINACNDNGYVCGVFLGSIIGVAFMTALAGIIHTVVQFYYLSH